MKNRHLTQNGALTAVLATVLGFTSVQAADVYLQAEQYQKTIQYGSAAGAPSYSVAVVNASFELPDCDLGAPDCPNSSFTNGNIAGWTVSGGGAGVFDINENAGAVIEATDGDQVGYSNGGTISQVLTETLRAETVYTLTVDVGDRGNTSFADYSVALYAGNTLLAEENSLAPVTAWASSVSVSAPIGAADPAIGQPLEIRLSAAGPQVEFDNVRLDAVASAAVVTMWGYSECNSDFSACGTPSSPGPQIDVPTGDSGLNVTVRNTLPEATSIMIAGQANPPLSNPAAVRTPDGRLTSFVDVVAAAIPATVVPVAVNNAGFEAQVLADGGFVGSVSGWTGSGGGTFNPTSAQLPGEASEGSNTHYSNGGAYSQTLGENLQATTYTLTVDVADRADTAFPGYQVQLGVDNGGFVLLAEDNSGLAPSSGFLTSVVSFTATAGDPNLGSPLVIRLVGAGVQVNFDNVRLDRTDGAAVVSTGTYSWPNLRPGTYLYHSGSHVQLQVHMGLYGAVVQDAASCNGASPCAYADASYDAQEVLVFSEIDPALHDPVPRPANATVNGYRPQFFLINGEPFDGTVPPAIANAGDNVLIRTINAGLNNRTVQLLGGHFQVLAGDGRRLPTTQSQFNVLLPAAKSLDLMFAPTAAGTYPLFDRRLYLVNGPVHGGGMFHRIVIN